MAAFVSGLAGVSALPRLTRGQSRQHKSLPAHESLGVANAVKKLVLKKWEIFVFIKAKLFEEGFFQNGRRASVYKYKKAHLAHIARG